MKPLNPLKEAKAILKDLKQEHDLFSLSCMTKEEAVETVECYSFAKEDIAPIAEELFNLTQLIN